MYAAVMSSDVPGSGRERVLHVLKTKGPQTAARVGKRLGVTDKLQRPIGDLRTSVTDRCNFRCVYCMPKEVFGRDYQFLVRNLDGIS